MRALAIVLGIVVAPVAVPAWTAEWIVRRWRPGFEFGTFNATPYFMIVVAVSTAGVIEKPKGIAGFAAIYILFTLEITALTVCATIAIVSPGRLQLLFRTAARRSVGARTLIANRTTIYSVIVSAGFTVFFFAALSYLLWQGNPSFFNGVWAHSSRLYIFWQFIQYSFLTITNAGAGLTPHRFLSELIRDIELIVGIFLLVFLLSVLASGWAERALTAARMREQFERQNPPEEE